MNASELIGSLQSVFGRTLFQIAGTPINVTTLLMFALILAATFWISRILQKTVSHSLRLWGLKDEGSLAVSMRLLHYLVMAVGTAVALHTIGINLTALFAAGAIFAFALGFAMQNIAQNFVAGIILLAERSIKPGDVLEVDGRTVRVRHLGIRSTIARTLNEEEIIVPNSILVQSPVKNHTLSDRLYRLRASVGVVYSSDMAQVRTVLERAAADLQWRHKGKAPLVLLLEFGSSSVDWQVSIWIDDPWRMQRLRSDLNEAIWWALKNAGITIAFPQLDVHLDPPVVESLEAWGESAPRRPRPGRPDQSSTE